MEKCEKVNRYLRLCKMLTNLPLHIRVAALRQTCRLLSPCLASESFHRNLPSCCWKLEGFLQGTVSRTTSLQHHHPFPASFPKNATYSADHEHPNSWTYLQKMFLRSIAAKDPRNTYEKSSNGMTVYPVFLCFFLECCCKKCPNRRHWR